MHTTVSQTGPHPDPQDWYEGSDRRLEIQTDKLTWKVIPCTHGGCDVDLLVNTFYAPAKGKCSAHGSAKSSAIATSKLVHSDSPETATPNGLLAKLLCPMCENTLQIYAIDDKTGWVTFHCTDGIHLSIIDVARNHDKNGGQLACGTSVTVRYGGAWVDQRAIPTPFRALVEDFNIGQKVQYYDDREARNASSTTAVSGTIDS